MKEKKIVDMLQDISSDICDHYCKYPEIYSKEEEEDKLYEYCYKCPLNKLM